MSKPLRSNFEITKPGEIVRRPSGAMERYQPERGHDQLTEARYDAPPPAPLAARAGGGFFYGWTPPPDQYDPKRRLAPAHWGREELGHDGPSRYHIQDDHYGMDLHSLDDLLAQRVRWAADVKEANGTQFGPSERQALGALDDEIAWRRAGSPTYWNSMTGKGTNDEPKRRERDIQAEYPGGC